MLFILPLKKDLVCRNIKQKLIYVYKFYKQGWELQKYPLKVFTWSNIRYELSWMLSWLKEKLSGGTQFEKERRSHKKFVEAWCQYYKIGVENFWIGDNEKINSRFNELIMKGKSKYPANFEDDTLKVLEKYKIRNCYIE